jgi:hypothetical protein
MPSHQHCTRMLHSTTSRRKFVFFRLSDIRVSQLLRAARQRVSPMMSLFHGYATIFFACMHTPYAIGVSGSSLPAESHAAPAPESCMVKLAVMYLQGPRLRKTNPPRIERIKGIEGVRGVASRSCLHVSRLGNQHPLSSFIYW